jgi:hypothetical protein
MGIGSACIHFLLNEILKDNIFWYIKKYLNIFVCIRTFYLFNFFIFLKIFLFFYSLMDIAVIHQPGYPNQFQLTYSF